MCATSSWLSKHPLTWGIITGLVISTCGFIMLVIFSRHSYIVIVSESLIKFGYMSGYLFLFSLLMTHW